MPKIDASMAMVRREDEGEGADDAAGSFIGNEMEEGEQSEECLTPPFPESSNDYYHELLLPLPPSAMGHGHVRRRHAAHAVLWPMTMTMSRPATQANGLAILSTNSSMKDIAKLEGKPTEVSVRQSYIHDPT